MAAGRRGPLPRLVLAVAAIALFVLAYQWGGRYRDEAGEASAIAGVRIASSRPLPEALANPSTEGAPTLLGHWTLTALADDPQAPEMGRLVEVYNRLADRPELRARLQLLLIAPAATGGPASDFARLSPAFHQLAGDDADRTRWRIALGAGDAEAPPALFLIDPEARLTALFPAAQAPARIAEDLRLLIDEGHR